MVVKWLYRGWLRSLLGGLVERGVFLPRTPPRALARHDRAAQEQFAAPDAPRLPPIECALKAAEPRPASPAERLRRLHVLRAFGEEQLRVFGAGKIQATRHAGAGDERRDADRYALLLHHANRLEPGRS